jgi:hypothetical protein
MCRTDVVGESEGAGSLRREGDYTATSRPGLVDPKRADLVRREESRSNDTSVKEDERVEEHPQPRKATSALVGEVTSEHRNSAGVSRRVSRERHSVSIIASRHSPSQQRRDAPVSPPSA